MSELIQSHNHGTVIRWRLLTGASALALVAYVSPTVAQDVDRPQVWIELDGQLSRLQDGREVFKPPFVALTPAPFSPPQDAERPPRHGIDGTATVTFQPTGSDWSFSAAIRYGRASSNKRVHQETYPGLFSYYIINRQGVKHYHTAYPSAARFADAKVNQRENYAILDFQIGREVGIGLFGTAESSSLNAGVRIAQFQSKSRVFLAEDPDWHIVTHLYDFYGLIKQSIAQPYHSYAGRFQADASFNGIGPSLSWNNSMPLAGRVEDRAFTLDWGVNASLLFGRQKARTQHQTTAHYQPLRTGAFPYPDYLLHPITVYQHAPQPQLRSRSVIVPNIGGFAGLSFRYTNARISFGYKADFFFGAIDGGIDSRKTYDRDFYGPFATVSIGLGG